MSSKKTSVVIVPFDTATYNFAPLNIPNEKIIIVVNDVLYLANQSIFKTKKNIRWPVNFS